jgi:hypothetical protein
MYLKCNWRSTIFWDVKLCILVCWLAYLLTLKMEAIHSSETLVNFYQITWYHSSEYNTLHSHCNENLKSNINFEFQATQMYSVKKLICSLWLLARLYFSPFNHITCIYIVHKISSFHHNSNFLGSSYLFEAIIQKEEGTGQGILNIKSMLEKVLMCMRVMWKDGYVIRLVVNVEFLNVLYDILLFLSP